MTSNTIRGGRGRGRGCERGCSQDVYSYYNKRGHQRSTCYRLIGFPSIFPSSKSNKVQEDNTNLLVANPTAKSTSGNEAHTAENSFTSSFFTPTQYSQILDMLKRDSDQSEAAVSIQAVTPGHAQWSDKRDW